MPELTIPEDGMSITRDTILKPGVYYLPNGLRITADQVTLDGNGALIIGDSGGGRGVSVNQCSGVTIRNLRAERFYHGIWVNAGANIRVEKCQITRTHELAGPDVFLDVWLDRSQAYGGGIFFSGVIDSFIIGNDVQHQQNGILLYGCNRIEVTHNNASYSSGYGLLLYESSDNTIEDNTADFCCRIYHYQADGERYHNGADAAGLVIMCNSSRNIVRHNRLRSSGDGVFLGGFHKDQIKVPCNDNLFERNDGSNSPNIAFEATFSQRNIFRNNRADNCNYGFWLGYSSYTQVEGNRICGNRIAGIAIEQGHHNTISGNTIEHNGAGAQVWAGARPAFAEWFPECVESYETALIGNTFRRNQIAAHVWSERVEPASGVPLARCHHVTLRDNTIMDNRIGVLIERARECVVQHNRIAGNVEAGVKLVGARDVLVEGNTMDAPA
ncbi:MAG: right-handed parallel beta-helix repeat-containing protein [Anaerolineae bacterium]|nr:right-handed parallel beta-helix repeat-containing protein [Thermoflexales bacterium]MDW8408185.1 right-handed parallel beta-helix repeat-containing protein [Anaerolineae bacterium]